MCLAFLTYYPANDDFSACLQWRSVDVCSNVPVNCDLSSFQKLTPSISTVCSTGCSDTCRLVMMALLATECLTGEIPGFLSYIDNEGMKGLYNVMDSCGITSTSASTTTSYPAATGSSSSHFCDVTTFIQLGNFLPVLCSADNCSNTCKWTVTAMMNMGCMNGDSLKYLMSKDRNGMMWIYGLISWCNIPTTTTMSPTLPPVVGGAVSSTKTTASLAVIVSAASLLYFNVWQT